MKSEKYLTRTEDYAKVYEKGRSRADSLLVMKAVPNNLAFSRYGFSVSRRVGKATVRNRVKRLLREILRQLPLKPGFDIVFIARTPSAESDYATLRKSVKNLLCQAQIIARNYEGACFSAN